MSLRQKLVLVFVVSGFSIPCVASAQSYPRAGWRATLSTFAHGTRGTVTIVDADTFRVDSFYYDGGGVDVHFLLAPENTQTSFNAYGLLTDTNFLGSAHAGDSATVNLSPGTSFDGYNAISLWCVPFHANFGSGTFVGIAPEPTSLGMAATIIPFIARRQRIAK